jgi:hypothetical protein
LAPNAPITFVHRTPGDFGACGVLGALTVRHPASSGFYMGPMPGAKCVNNQPGYSIEINGAAVISALEPLPDAPSGCR